MLRWSCSRGLVGSCIQEVLTEDAGRCVARLGVLVLHLGRVLAEVRVPRRLSDGAGTGQEVKEPGQGACPSRSPAHASQEQATPQKR